MSPFTKATQERRSGRRIVTLRNASWMALSLIMLLAVVSTYSKYRDHNRTETRPLFERTNAALPPAEPIRPVESITEAPISQLDENARGEPFLRVPPPASATTATMPPETSTAPTLASLRRDGGRVVISGGSDGVRVDVQAAHPASPVTPPR